MGMVPATVIIEGYKVWPLYKTAGTLHQTSRAHSHRERSLTLYESPGLGWKWTWPRKSCAKKYSVSLTVLYTRKNRCPLQDAKPQGVGIGT
eukprot:scaffold28362_cov65-Phaeocystis_antarctica.AAC.7